ncbi:MAG: RNA polymerase sigma factor [Butyricicoccaceae bacterium]
MDTNQEEQIRRLYLEMYDLLLAYAYSVLKNYALAEEAVQDTFRIACAKADQLLASPNPQGWLKNTLKYVLLNMQHSRARLNNLMIELIQSDQWKAQGKCDEEDVDVLYSDLSQDENFQLLKEIILKQRSMLEVAQQLGISVEACKKRVQRAKKDLQTKLSKRRE